MLPSIIFLIASIILGILGESLSAHAALICAVITFCTYKIIEAIKRGPEK